MSAELNSVQLVSCLKQDDLDAWRQLDQIYLPLIRSTLERYGISRGHAEDIAQEALIVVWRKVRSFRRLREGSFRCWLRSITVNCLRDYCRKQRRHEPNGGEATQAIMQALQDPHSDLSRDWDAQHQEHVLALAMQQAEPQFAGPTWQAFHATAVQGCRTREVAAELGLTENAVCIAKSRVTARIREIAHGMLG